VKKHGNVVADNSFYSCYICDLQRREWIERFISLYQFHYGPTLYSEMPKPLSSQCLSTAIRHEEDYSALFLPLITSSHYTNHHEDGEYEAIFIACKLAQTSDLAYLILDDRVPYKCAKRIPVLQEKVTGTIGFIKDSYLKDQVLSQKEAVDMLKAIHERFSQESSEKHRPCSMDPIVVEQVLLPAIDEVKNRKPQ